MEKEEGEVSDVESEGRSVVELGSNFDTKFLDSNDLSRLKSLTLNLNLNIHIYNDDIEKVYKDMGLDDVTKKEFRSDALYLQSDDDVSPNHVLEMFRQCKPFSIDTISSSTCAVIFENNAHALLALLKCSTSVNNAMEEESDLLVLPFHRRIYNQEFGRYVVRFAKRNESSINKDVSFSAEYYQQLERTNNSVKSRLFSALPDEGGTKNPWGDLSKRWGVFDHQEVYGPLLPPKPATKDRRVVCSDSDSNDQSPLQKVSQTSSTLSGRLGKRVNRNASLSNDSNDESKEDDDYWTKRNKQPRMRMRADDEQEKIKMKPKFNITIETQDENGTSDEEIIEQSHSRNSVDQDEKPTGDVYTRLGIRENSSDSEENFDYSSDEDERARGTGVLSCIQRVNNNSSNPVSVWSRLEKTAVERGKNKDLRTKLTKTKSVITEVKEKLDLRKKLENRKEIRRSPLRIEIDNNYYS